MSEAKSGLVFAYDGLDLHEMFSEPKFNQRAVLQCKDENQKIALDFCKTPEGYIEMRWCANCLEKNAEKIINNPYLKLCTILSDEETVEKLNGLFTKFAPNKVIVSVVDRT